MVPADHRAVSEVVGAVIIFAFLVISFSIYQGIVIPQQNRASEFQHNQNAQESIQDLRNAIRQTAATASEQSVSITLGATYPQRVVGINPGASAGSIQTEELGTITLRNITATEPETADYFGSNTTTLGAFESQRLVFRPVYTHYTERPVTSYENTLVVNHFPNGANLTITDQTVVRGSTITLIALDGNVSRAQQETVTIDTRAVSTEMNTVPVESADGPLNVTIDTRMSAADWDALLEGEEHVQAVRQTGPTQVSILLEEGEVYNLRMAKVGVGSGVTDEGPKYIVDVEGNDTSVIEDGKQKLVIEVRDRFNNPVDNVTVTASITTSAGSGDSVHPLNQSTGANGRASFTYTAPEDVSDSQDAVIEMAFDGDGTPNETVAFNVRVLDASGGGGDDGGTGSINPSESVVYINSTITGPGDNTVTVFFNNTNDTSVEFTQVRFQFYSVSSEGTGRGGPPQSMDFAGDTVKYLDRYTDVSETISPGIDSIELEFFEGENETTDTFDVRRNDFFILTIRTDAGNTITYFMGVSRSS